MIAPDTIELIPDVSKNQVVYVNLEKKEVTNLDTTANWHLKFSTAPESWNIFLNGLEDVALHKTTTTEFNEIDTTFNLTGLKWEVDIPTSNSVVPAIGDWGDFDFEVPQSFKTIYILRVRDVFVSRFVKLQVLNASPGAYKVRYGSLNGDFENTVLIPKDASYNFSYLALNDTALFREIEPPKDQWTFNYTFISDSIDFASNIPYAPTINPYFGIYPAVQINKENTLVYIDRKMGFDAIDFFEAQSFEFETVEQLKNFFVNWNSDLDEAEINEEVTLVLKQNEELFALQPKSIIGDFPDNFRLKLRVKKL